MSRFSKRTRIHLALSFALLVCLAALLRIFWLPNLVIDGLAPDKVHLVEAAYMIERFKTDCGRYPPEQLGLRALTESGVLNCPLGSRSTEPYLSKIPIDRWGNHLTYQLIEDGNFSVRFLGKDRVPGGMGEDADLVYDSVKKRVYNSDE